MSKTCREVATEYLESAKGFDNYWRCAFVRVAYVCRKYHKSRAIRKLKREAIAHEGMIIQSVFRGAINDLEGTRTDG